MGNEEMMERWREVNGTESQADKLFEELGYTLEIDGYFDGTKIYTYYLRRDGESFRDFIRFKYDGTMCTCFKTWFSMQELKAINMKCRELGWSDE